MSNSAYSTTHRSWRKAPAAMHNTKLPSNCNLVHSTAEIKTLPNTTQPSKPQRTWRKAPAAMHQTKPTQCQSKRRSTVAILEISAQPNIYLKSKTQRSWRKAPAAMHHTKFTQCQSGRRSAVDLHGRILRSKIALTKSAGGLGA